MKLAPTKMGCYDEVETVFVGKTKLTYRILCRRKPSFTRTAKSGKEKNAKDKKGDKEMLAEQLRISQIVIAQNLTTVYLFQYPYSPIPTCAKI